MLYHKCSIAASWWLIDLILMNEVCAGELKILCFFFVVSVFDVGLLLDLRRGVAGDMHSLFVAQ